MGGFLTARADWAALLDTIYAPTADEQRWSEEVHQAARRVFQSSHGAGFSLVRHAPTCDVARFDAASMDAMPDALRAGDGGMQTLGVEGFRHYYYPPGLIATHLEIEARVAPEIAAGARAMRATVGVEDVIGVLAHPTPGRIATIFAMHDGPITLSHHERDLLARVGLHLDAAVRLRSAPEQLCAVLDVNGRFLHRDPEHPVDDALAARVARLASSPSPLEIWSSLVAGRMTLVRRPHRGKLVYFVLDNPPPTRELRALSEGEAAAVAQAARGLPTKLVSYALGVSSGVVSERLASAAAKLGFATRTELVRLAAMLTRDPRASFPKVDLTAAEREILVLLQQGLTNEAIARHRSRSLRTIANQVASLLRKTNSPSRRALAVAGDP